MVRWLNKTKIEWADYSWNAITGCLNDCPFCYARKMWMRFHGHFDYEFHEERLGAEFDKIPEGSKIFVNSVGEWFGDWVEKVAVWSILEVIRKNPSLYFISLTKCPMGLSHYQFPENLWTGVSICKQEQVYFKDLLLHNSDAKIKFISFEPLLEEIDIDLHGMSWCIIGAQTQPNKQPKDEWVTKLVAQAWELNIPVFLKPNLKIRNSFPEELREEFPDL
jgi:protein gp37